MKRLAYLLSIAAAFIAAACADKDSFTVEGQIEGGGAQTVELLYFTDGAAKRLTAAASDGKFSLTGTAPRPALAYLSVAGNAPLATLVVENGDNISCTVNPDSTVWKASGNQATELLARFTAENASLLRSGDDAAVNSAVAAYVKANPKRVASAALIVTCFRTRGHELQLDSIMSLLAPEARQPAVLQNFMSTVTTQISLDARQRLTPMSFYESRDTTYRYVAQRQTLSLFAFTDDDRTARDSIIPRLQALADSFPARRCRIIEVSLALDSAEWRRTLATTPEAEWQRVWAPGSVSAPLLRKLAVSRVPFFIVADSLGDQLYRGSSVSHADNLIRSRLKP